MPFRLMVDAARACYAARILRSPALEPTPRFGGRARLLGITVLAALCATEHRGLARTEDGVHRTRVSHRARAHQPDAPPPPPATPPDDPPATPPPEDPRTNVHLVPSLTIALPGRGLSVAWSPDGTRLAVGGHFRDKETRLRYDTRVADVAAGALVKSFACHWFWAVSQAWVDHPDYGPLLADGGGDHAVKVWNPDARGSSTCHPGQFLAADGALQQLGEINGWITSLAFSPDRRWLAGASRDRTVRIWQVHPGPNAWRVAVSGVAERPGLASGGPVACGRRIGPAHLRLRHYQQRAVRHDGRSRRPRDRPGVVTGRRDAGVDGRWPAAQRGAGRRLGRPGSDRPAVALALIAQSARPERRSRRAGRASRSRLRAQRHWRL